MTTNNTDADRLLHEVFALCEATEDAPQHEPKNEHQRGFDLGRRFEAKQIRKAIGTWFQDTFCGASHMGEPVIAAPQQAEADWLHLKPYGYAPGGYMSRCRKCGDTPTMDKRATACRPCAEAMYANRHADEVARLKAVIAELDDANNAYAKFTRDEGMEAHRRNRERLIAAWQAARKAAGRDEYSFPQTASVQSPA
jgi:hypothetical protein